MEEEEYFWEQEKKSLEDRINKMAEAAADQWIENARNSLDILTLHQAYKRGYRDAMTDVVFKGKNNML